MSGRRMTGCQRAVATEIFNRVDKDGRKAFVSAATIAEATGYTTRSVERALSWLRTEGIVIQVRKGGSNGSGKESWPSVYQLTQPDIPVGVNGSTQPDTHVELSGPTQPDIPVTQPDIPVTQPDTDVGLSDPLYPEPLNPEPSLARVSNAGASTLRPSSIDIEKNQPFIPEDKRTDSNRYAEWSHLLRRDLIVELEDLSARVIQEGALDESVTEVTDQLLRTFAESTRPQTRAGVFNWIQDVNSIEHIDKRVIEAILDTLTRRAA